jgi:hypothetical protein
VAEVELTPPVNLNPDVPAGEPTVCPVGVPHQWQDSDDGQTCAVCIATRMRPDEPELVPAPPPAWPTMPSEFEMRLAVRVDALEAALRSLEDWEIKTREMSAANRWAWEQRKAREDRDRHVQRLAKQAEAERIKAENENWEGGA